MSTYLITFTPSGAYFFGNDKTLKYPGQKNGVYGNLYYVSGENLPSQSTLLGAVRYALLPVKRSDRKYSDEEKARNSKAIGCDSFSPESTTAQSYGSIKTLSPLFLHDGKMNYVLAPMADAKAGNDNYVPLDCFKKANTDDGLKLYSENYDVKCGIPDAFISLDTGALLNSYELFTGELRTGIKRSAKDDGYFKKEYKVLKSGYSFALYAEIDNDSLDNKVETVCLGQGRTPFAVKFKKAENTLKDGIDKTIGKALAKVNLPDVDEGRPTFIYCIGDAFVNDGYYEKVLFAVTSTKDYRSFYVSNDGYAHKGEKLYKQLKAGSILITTQPDKWLESQKNTNAEAIGYNNFIIFGGNNK